MQILFYGRGRERERARTVILLHLLGSRPRNVCALFNKRRDIFAISQSKVREDRAGQQ